ncbi:MAG TPA: hypothetical protein PLO63_01870 [Syntrophales bacterium]|nr:hypothetical protein [Syntrophales bacterium]
MKTPDPIERLTSGGAFSFRRLDINGIDNDPVFRVNDPKMVREETCLFHRDVLSGNDYVKRIGDRVAGAVARREPLPVVRFADGEYAFYHFDLACNGLYKQAESKDAIRESLPMHAAALQELSRAGFLAPLVFPGNIEEPAPAWKALFKHWRRRPSATTFLRYLEETGIPLTGENYVPFYAVYAYFSSAAFARLMDGRQLAILNSDSDGTACTRWFEGHGSRPRIELVDIPNSYVATRWNDMKEDVLGRVPAGVDLLLVGAGIGALPVCVDAARRFGVPAVDAGHVLNMMNDRVDKSNGARLYTLWK